MTPVFGKISGIDQDCALLYDYRMEGNSVDQTFALFLGDIFSDRKQSDRLAALYPASYLLVGYAADYLGDRNQFTSWGSVVRLSPHDLLSKYRCVVIQGRTTLEPFERLGDLHPSITTLFPGPPWPIYRLNSPWVGKRLDAR